MFGSTFSLPLKEVQPLTWHFILVQWGKSIWKSLSVPVLTCSLPLPPCQLAPTCAATSIFVLSLVASSIFPRTTSITATHVSHLHFLCQIKEGSSYQTVHTSARWTQISNYLPDLQWGIAKGLTPTDPLFSLNRCPLLSCLPHTRSNSSNLYPSLKSHLPSKPQPRKSHEISIT
jgi:hypothetical protein